MSAQLVEHRYHSSGRPFFIVEALAALRSLGFDIDPTRGTVHGPLVVRS